MAKKILEDFKIKKGNIKDIFPRDVNIDNSHIYKEEIISNNNEINHNPIIKNSLEKDYQVHLKYDLGITIVIT